MSPFKTYVLDDISGSREFFSDLTVTSYYDDLPNSSGTGSIKLSDFSNRFELLEACVENESDPSALSYRCIAGDLTSKFYDKTSLGLSEFESLFGNGLVAAQNNTEVNGVAGNIGAINNFSKYVDLFDPNALFSNQNSEAIDYCSQSASNMKSAIEASRMGSFTVGKSSSII